MARSGGLDGAARIVAAIEDLGPNSFGGSLACFGDILGGKVDNYHELTEVHAFGKHLILLFDEGVVSVHVWNPTGLKMGVPGLVITGASKVVLEVMPVGSATQSPDTRTTEYLPSETGEIEVRADWQARIPRIWRFGRRKLEREVSGTELAHPVPGAPAFEIIDHTEFFTPADG